MARADRILWAIVDEPPRQAGEGMIDGAKRGPLPGREHASYPGRAAGAAPAAANRYPDPNPAQEAASGLARARHARKALRVLAPG